LLPMALAKRKGKLIAIALVKRSMTIMGNKEK
jgi:hypothetical protein